MESFNEMSLFRGTDDHSENPDFLTDSGTNTNSPFPIQLRSDTCNSCWSRVLILEHLPREVKFPPTSNEQDGLLRAMSTQNQRIAMGGGHDERAAQELHDQVFSNERGYLNQSDVFRKSLFSNQESSDGNSDNGKSTAANNNKNGATSQEELDQVAWRRGAEYRRIQKEAMSTIETDMAALEQSVSSREQAIEIAMEESK
jgi:hypothetical protein